MTPLAFAWRSLTRQPARAVLGIVGITAVGALLLDMLLLSRGLVLSFEQLLGEIGFDVRVTATEAMPLTGPVIEDLDAVVRRIAGLPEVEAVVPTALVSSQISAGSSRVIAPLLGIGPGGRGAWTLLEGRGLPDREGPMPTVLLNRALARRLASGPGGLVTVHVSMGPASALPPARFLVSGIVDMPWDAPGTPSALTSLPGLARALGRERVDTADLLLVASRPGAGGEAAVAAIRRAVPDVHAYSNEQLVTRFARTDFSYFRQISFLLSTITILFTVLLVATLLTVSVNQRLGEVAALRALGFPRRRVLLDVLCESALLVGSGALLSIPVGLGVARGLDAILKDIPDFPARMHFFVLEPRAIVLHLALLLGGAALAAIYPLVIVGRLPIAATLRQETL